MDSISGKVALVTGANRGIGRAIAHALAQVGANVAVNYRNGEHEANSLCEQIEQFGGRSIAVQADVSNPADVDRLVETIEQSLGTVAILVNNAGIARPQPLEAIGVADWDELINVNLKSAFLVTQAVLPPMRQQQWGRIINLSSVAAQVGGVIGPHYAASKAGLLGLTHAYASILAKEGITVNAIAPALIATDMISDNPRIRPDLIPVGRFGEVEEVADVAVMLARNAYITGQTINVNGGWYMS
ncbi:3-oxoacyl-ACP reductase [Nostoc sp. T09]|uniref:3-oxoacyl-ACP reductase family protein n=1 Tax=Nostoc sp. T09 TaxID=1932621 RepID=UPI000A3788CC|nr:3-oxoacyl-ACP reductase family protein [Nostoc sp. T09]OUL36958.1 3-oxoacyl-ACP reductase [Nostoc sp. T09]